MVSEEVTALLRLCAGELPDDLARFPWLRMKAAQVALERGHLPLAAQLAREALPPAGNRADGATASDGRPALLYSIAGLILLRVVADAVFARPGADALAPAELEAVIDEIERRLPGWEAALQTLPPRYRDQFEQAQYAYFEATFDLDGREGMEREQRVPANDPRVEQARGLARSGELDAAIEGLPRRSKLAAWAHRLDVARLALESGDRQGYREKLAAITREHPEAGPVQLALALAYHREGDTAPAIDHARHALSAVPAASYRAVLAACLAEGGRSTEAWQLLSRDLNSRRPRIVVQLAELTEKQAPQQAPGLWRRYAELTGRHEARLRELRALAAAGREDEAARRGWDFFEHHGSELDPEELFWCAWPQRALASSFEREERLRRVARVLDERFPNDPRAQQLRLRLHLELGDAAEDRFDKFELLEEARLVSRFNADEMIGELVVMKQASTDRENRLWDFYAVGGISLSGLAKSLRAPLVRLVEAVADSKRRVCAPVSFESAMMPELSECELLLDEPVCLLLGSLGLLPVLARVTAANGLHLVLPSDARDAVIEAALDSGSVSGKEARTLRAVRDFMLEGLAKKWLQCLEWPELQQGLAEPIPEVPPVRDAKLESIVREPLTGALQLAGAVLASARRWRGSLDHFGHWGVHHRDALQSIVWRDARELMKLSLFLRGAASRTLSVPQLVRLLWQHSATSEYRRLEVCQCLAAAGFPDGMTGTELARASSLISTDNLGRILDGLEQSAVPSAPLGGFLGRHSICETYSHALVFGYLGAQTMGSTVGAVGESVADESWFGSDSGQDPSARESARRLAELLLWRVERLSASTGTVLEQLLSQVVALVLRSRRASFVPGPVAGEYEISATSAAGGLWRDIGEWAGGYGSRRSALQRALRDAWCVLAALSGAEGPTVAAQAPLVLAQRVTRGLESQGRSRPSDAVPQLDDAEVAAILSWRWKAKPLEHDGIWFTSDDGQTQIAWETILGQAHADLAHFPSDAAPPFDERRFRRDLQLGMAGEGRPRFVTVLAPVEAVLLRLHRDDLQRMAPFVRYFQGRHDGHAYALLRELGTQPDDEAQRQRYAHYSATALWRAVREDPAYLLRWTDRVPVFDDELRPSLESLCRILYEPQCPVGEHTYAQWLNVWWQHVADSVGEADPASRWVARDLLLFASEVPGMSYGAETLVFLLEGDIGFAEEALQRLRDPDSHPAAVLARDVLVLRWLSVHQPILALDSGATDLREVLPELLERLVRSVRSDATVPAESSVEPVAVPTAATGVTFASREHELLRACGGVVWNLLRGRGDRRQSDFLWFTYRLHAWLARQLAGLTPERRSDGIERLASAAPPVWAADDLQRDRFGDLFNPFLFEVRGINYRQFLVLFALSASADLVRRGMQRRAAEGPEASESDTAQGAATAMLRHPALEQHLLELAAQASLQDAPAPTWFDWPAPRNAPDLALRALLLMNAERVSEIGEDALLIHISRITSPSRVANDPDWWLTEFFVHVLSDAASRLSSALRSAFEQQLQQLGAKPEDLPLRCMGLTALFASGVTHLEKDVAALIEGQLDASDAELNVSLYLTGVGRSGSTRLKAEVHRLLDVWRERPEHGRELLVRSLARWLVQGDHPLRDVAMAMLAELGQPRGG
ncbi:MAG TPA: hypothetical protein VJU61_08550 [Polyangiaceae bacterium]|nr:hypothetical protein [Polyangiaceae bacterium]